MKRVRWMAALLLLIGIGAATWFLLSRRDTDFIMVGPKTVGVRDNFAKLDAMIDPADFRDCKTVEQALRRLNEKLGTSSSVPGVEPDPWFVRMDLVGTDPAAFAQKDGANLLNKPFQAPVDAQRMTLKQFLRMTFSQAGVSELSFVVRGHYIEATTATRAQEERARYLDSVGVIDRMHGMWKELTGNLEQDAPDVMFFDVL